MKSGGPADVHWFHGSLGKLGYKTKMYKVNEEYRHDTLAFSSMTQESFDRLVLQKNDLLVVGELAVSEDAESLIKTGGKLVRWLQGVPSGTAFYGYDGGGDASTSHSSWNEPLTRLASNHWVHANFYCPGYPIDPPLEQAFYARAYNGQRTWDDHKRRGVGDAPRNWVLIDDDFNTLVDFDSGEFQRVLENLISTEEASTGQSFERFNVVGLKSYNRKELIDLYKGARVMIDMYIPGKERSNYEASLFDVCIIVANYMSGKDEVDFPGDVGRITPYNATDAAIKVFRGVYDYFKPGLSDVESPCQGGGSSQLKSLGVKLMQNSIVQADRYVRSRHFKFVTFAITTGQFRALWPFICSVLVTHPLAEIEVWVENASPYYLDMYGGGISTRATLATFGLLKNVHFMEITSVISKPVDGSILLESLLSQNKFFKSVSPYILWVPLSGTSSTLIVGSEFLNSLVYDLEERESPSTALVMVDVEASTGSDERSYFFSNEIFYREGMVGDSDLKECNVASECSAGSGIILLFPREDIRDDCRRDKIEALTKHPVFRLCGASCELHVVI